MSVSFTLHLLGAIPSTGPYLEFSIEGADYYPWQGELFTTDIFVRDGCVQIPEALGWSVGINPRWLAAANYRKSEH